VQTQVPAAPKQPEAYEHTLRPYPSSGAIHDLELYLTVSRCTGLEPGLYHYDPLAHELERLAGLGEKQQRLVRDAQCSSAMKQAPDILITLATRFGRVAWKYESIAYSLSQKNVGCLYQQMYLVATALGLAPCSLGGGNSDQFAEATGLDYYVETSVGEFMLSSRVA
jgi:SagB-type dehydrogenase family enzyme